MQSHLNLLAEASLAVQSIEDALGDGAFHAAHDAADRAAALLAELRTAWPAMAPAERAVVGRAAAPLRRRLDAARRRLPRLAAVSVAAAEVDPEQELDPER